MRRRFRIWDSVRHAQAYGLARRIQRAAKLRPRHRAKTDSRQVVKSKKQQVETNIFFENKIYFFVKPFRASMKSSRHRGAHLRGHLPAMDVPALQAVPPP